MQGYLVDHLLVAEWCSRNHQIEVEVWDLLVHPWECCLLGSLQYGLCRRGASVKVWNRDRKQRSCKCSRKTRKQMLGDAYFVMRCRPIVILPFVKWKFITRCIQCVALGGRICASLIISCRSSDTAVERNGDMMSSAVFVGSKKIFFCRTRASILR